MINFKIVAGEKETAEKLLANIKSFVGYEMNQASINLNESRSNKYITMMSNQIAVLRTVMEYLNEISIEE
jgi:hypothetical protein